MSKANIAKLMETMRKMTKVIKPPGPPKVWKVVEKTGKNGRPHKFTIQEIPKDRNEEAVKHMCKYFLADEPTCACFNAVNTPIFVEECIAIWRSMLEQSIAIAVFVDNPNGREPIMAGANILWIKYKEHEKYANDLHFASKFEISNQVTSELCKEVQMYERYGIDKYLYGLGISVAPAFRGYGLGTEILKVRDQVGREYNIPATCATFTSPIMAKAAENAGFELLLVRDYTDTVDNNGKEYFPGIQKYSKRVAVMAKRLC